MKVNNQIEIEKKSKRLEIGEDLDYLETLDN